MPKRVVILLGLSAALIVAGFLLRRPDLSACAGPSSGDRSGLRASAQETVLPLPGAESEGETSVIQSSAGAAGGGADDLEPFGIVAPIFPGFGLGAYSSKCDPFSDPYGTCI